MNSKILVVDDEPGVRRVVRRVLSTEPYECLEAGDGAGGLALAAESLPDLIVLDVNMPGLDGNEVTRRLRADARTAMIPVLLLTGEGGPDQKVRGLESGADDYVTKPFDAPELAARVAGILRRNARALSANPLTRLPGAPAIERETASRLRDGESFSFLYADIDRFKPFNDAYGFARGDEAIKAAAELFTELVDPSIEGRRFLGHIGGDDFAAVVPLERGEPLAAELATRFDLLAPWLYSAEDRERGFLSGLDRRGRLQTFPIMTLSIAVVAAGPGGLEHYGQIAGVAAEIKRHLKSLPERPFSAHLADRRRRPRPA